MALGRGKETRCTRMLRPRPYPQVRSMVEDLTQHSKAKDSREVDMHRTETSTWTFLK